MEQLVESRQEHISQQASISLVTPLRQALSHHITNLRQVLLYSQHNPLLWLEVVLLVGLAYWKKILHAWECCVPFFSFRLAFCAVWQCVNADVLTVEPYLGKCVIMNVKIPVATDFGIKLKQTFIILNRKQFEF